MDAGESEVIEIEDECKKEDTQVISFFNFVGLDLIDKNIFHLKLLNQIS